MLRAILLSTLSFALACPIARAAPPEALESARQEAERHPDDPEAVRRLADLSHEAGGLTRLVEQTEQRAQSRPDDPRLRLLLGHLYRLAGRCDHAVEVYTSVAKQLKGSPSPHLGAAECHRLAERWGPAMEAYRAAAATARSRGDKRTANQQLLEVALRAERPDVAQEAYDALIASAPGDLFLRVDLARKLSAAGRLKMARTAWESILKRARGDQKLKVLAVKELGAVLDRLGEGDAAIKTFRDALRGLPTEHWARFELQEGLIGIYRRQGRIGEYIAELEGQRRSYPTLLLLARLYEETGDDRKALDAYREAVERRPANVDAQAAVLRILKRIGGRQELIAEYQRLSREVRGEPRYDLELAELQLKDGNEEKGFAILDRVSRKYPDDPGVHETVADLLMQHEGPRERIERAFAVLIRLEPHEETHLIALGEYYFGQNERAKAISTWNRLLKVMEAPARAHLALARIFAEHEMQEEAMGHFREAVRREPKDVRYYKAFAAYQERIHRYPDAAATWEKILSLLPETDYAGRRGARARIIDLLDRRQHLTARLGAHRRDFEASPPDLGAGLFLAQGHLHRREFTRAAQVLERIVEARPKHLEALLYLQEIYEKLNRLADAIDVLKTISELDPDGARPRLQQMARLSMELQRPEDALRYARQVVDLGPSDPAAQTHLADILAQTRRYDQALVAYRKALALAPDDVAVQFKLADVLDRLGRTAELASVLTEVVQRASEQTDVQTAGRRLLALPSLEALEQFEPVLLRATFEKPTKTIYRELLVDLYGAMVKRLALALSTSPEATRRKLQALGERGVKPIVDALASQNLAVRTTALEILIEARTQGAVLPLVRLLGEPDRVLRFQTLVALAHIGAPSAVEPISKLVTSREGNVGPGAVWALGVFGDRAAGQALAQAEEDKRRRDMVVIVTLAHGMRGQGSGLDHVLGAFRTGSPLERPYAAWALGAIGEPRALDALIERLPLEVGESRQAIIWALGAIASPRALEPLLAALWSRDAEVVPLALWALARVQSGRPLPREPLREAYLSLHDFSEAAVTLPNAVPRLMVTPGPARPDASALIARHGKTIRQVLLGQLSSSEPRSTRRALLAVADGTLAPLAPDMALPGEWMTALHAQATELLGSPEAEVRAEAATLLGRLGGATAAGALISALSDEAGVVRRAAAEALGSGTVPGASEALTRALTRGPLSETWAGRAIGADALARVLAARSEADDAAVNALRALLHDPFPAVRVAALRGLSAAGTRGAPATERVALLLKDRDPLVVRAAVDALGALGGAEARQALSSIETPDPKLRAAVQAALQR